jgi:hypothetical protein
MNLSETALFDGGAKLAGEGMFGLTGMPELIVRFGINLAVMVILIRWLYYTTTRRKDYFLPIS